MEVISSLNFKPSLEVAKKMMEKVIILSTKLQCLVVSFFEYGYVLFIFTVIFNSMSVSTSK